MDETHVVYKKVFEPIAKAFCAVMIMALMVLLFLSGYWLAESKNKGFIIINERLGIMQHQIIPMLVETNNRIAKLEPMENNILLTESEVIGWLNLTPVELEYWIEDGLRCSDIFGKRFYFEQDVISFIRHNSIDQKP